VRSEEGKDGSRRGDIVRGRARLFRGEVDISAVGGDENIIVTATGFHGQLISEVGSHGMVAGNSTDERGAVEGGGVKGIPEGWGGRTKRGECKGGLDGWGFGGAQVLSNYVQVTKGGEEGLGWVVEK
jgi:hypothetical protein